MILKEAMAAHSLWSPALVRL